MEGFLHNLQIKVVFLLVNRKLLIRFDQKITSPRLFVQVKEYLEKVSVIQ